MKKKRKIRAWISKYALSKGIFETEVILTEGESGAYRDGPSWQWFYANTWHRTEAEARTKAEEMRLKKIASLENQLAKLKDLKF